MLQGSTLKFGQQGLAVGNPSGEFGSVVGEEREDGFGHPRDVFEGEVVTTGPDGFRSAALNGNDAVYFDGTRSDHSQSRWQNHCADGRLAQPGIIGSALSAIDLGYQVVVVRYGVIGFAGRVRRSGVANSIAMIATIVTSEELLAVWSST